MEEDTTPLMEQYHRIKDECKDAILLFRMGDFYETFEDDAITAARELDIVLTSRQKDKNGNKIPMAGIPHKSLEPYLFKLVKKGYKVAVCDQVEDPAQSNGLVKREITRIVTPGTILESSMLDEKTNNFLSALFEDDGAVGMAFVDVSTGDFYVTETKSSDLNKKVLSEFVKFSPVECIVPASMSPFFADIMED
ncbi:MAG TPA: DNA mismatch repair protein MutS, partial [Halobacteria archaeon]|nr:DNA mismatch repair protein MutS [Halobacteria archaeon]